jgi:primosomal protein N' (replication factor Y)
VEGSATDSLVAEVVLVASIDKAFDYEIPSHLAAEVVKGVCVEIPVRGTITSGFVVKVKHGSSVAKLRPIHKVKSAGPVVTEELFELALWMARYYLCPLGKVLKTMLPAGVRKNVQRKVQYSVSCKKSKSELREVCQQILHKAPQQARLLEELLLSSKPLLLSELLETTGASLSSVKGLAEKGLIHLDHVHQDSSPFIGEEYFKTKPKTLTSEQQLAYNSITNSIESRSFQTHLLFGVTGSGKTEVYLQTIDYALQRGLGIIMLVPEIALTPQTIQHFKSRFSIPIGALHHRLSDGERLEAWENIQAGNWRICLGARSSIFCPMPDVGLIIVDEEHEPSYKQTEDSPCYHARDLAIMRAKMTNATILLGSATPSLESYHNALSKKYILNPLTMRPSAQLPAVHIVDMKREYAKAKGFTSFSDVLLSKVDERRQRGEQSILFLNRRGYHTSVSCTTCGESVHCPHCDTSLTFHMKEQTLFCHLCGYNLISPRSCPSCHAETLIKFSGVGTEKIEAMLHGIFPGIQTLRIDRDTTRHKGQLEELLQQFRLGKAEVLIGTQMVAKGLHFPQVTLVGVLNCDGALNIPDFRAQEGVFQLITQVAGRAGRGCSPGEVIVQTALSEHSTIHHAKEQNYTAFYNEEIAIRKQFHFPPYCRMIKFLFAGLDAEKVNQHATSYQNCLQAELSEQYTLHPVLPAGHPKVKDYYRFQFLLRGPSILAATQAILQADKNCPLPSTFYRFVDVDPITTFF